MAVKPVELDNYIRLLWVQCKYGRQFMSKKELDALLGLHEQTGGIPVLAEAWKGGPIVWRHLRQEA